MSHSACAIRRSILRLRSSSASASLSSVLSFASSEAHFVRGDTAYLLPQLQNFCSRDDLWPNRRERLLGLCAGRHEVSTRDLARLLCHTVDLHLLTYQRSHCLLHGFAAVLHLFPPDPRHRGVDTLLLRRVLRTADVRSLPSCAQYGRLEILL